MKKIKHEPLSIEISDKCVFLKRNFEGYKNKQMVFTIFLDELHDFDMALYTLNNLLEQETLLENLTKKGK